MNQFLIAYMKWTTDVMAVSHQVNQALLNQATSATYRAKKQKVSATIHYLNTGKQNENS